MTAGFPRRRSRSDRACICASSRSWRQPLVVTLRRAYAQNGSDFIRTDRKSTRLNSSHMSISYAVFCLKKKINREPGPAALPPTIVHDVLAHDPGLLIPPRHAVAEHHGAPTDAAPPGTAGVGAGAERAV